MKELAITETDAIFYAALAHSHAAEGNLLDTPMPNGKKLRDCTGAELKQIGEAMMKIGQKLEVRDA